MQSFTRLVLSFVAAAFALGPVSALAAPKIPCSTAKMVVPWKAGGDTDLVFRPVVNAINSTGFKPQLQVVNISGQSGNKGAKEVKASKPDGCTLFAMHESQITTYLAGRVEFTWDAFTPVARLTYTPDVLGSHSGVPYDDIKGLIAYAKQHPGEVKVGVTTGSTSQFVNLLVEDASNTQFKYVPYEGTRERLTALLAKNIDVGAINILTAKKYVQEGSMKALGIATEKRDPILPDLKTLKEQGINVVYGLHRGVVMPKGTKKAVVKYYEEAFRKAMKDPAVQKYLDEKGTWNVFMGAEDYSKFLKQSYADHEKVAIKIGMYKKK